MTVSDVGVAVFTSWLASQHIILPMANVVALKPCKFNGCHNPVTLTRYCEQHKEHEGKSWLHPYKESAESRGYGWKWKLLARKIKKSQPVCAVCKIRPTQEVDHIRPKSIGGTDDPANLQGLCSGCHKEKTAKERV